MPVPSLEGVEGASNATPIVITCSGHGFATGNTIQIKGVTGNTAANGIWSITVGDINHFTLLGSVGNGNYITGGNAQLVSMPGVDLSTEDIDVQETSTTTGTGDIALGGAPVGSAPAGVLADQQQAEYAIIDANGAYLESGLGTYDKPTNTFKRTEVFTTAANEIDTTPATLAAGTKTIYVSTPALIQPTPPGAGVDLGDFVQVANGGPPPPMSWGVLTVVNQNRPMNIDSNRVGGPSSSVYFRLFLGAPPPFSTVASHVRLLQTSQRVVADQASLQVGDMVQRFLDVLIPRPVDEAWSCALNAPSVLPFNVNNTKLAERTTMLALRPADVFMYLPHMQPGQAQPSPRMFWLNWYSNTARNNANAGAPVGHEIVWDADRWAYLDCEGAYSTYITSTEVFAKLPRRYLYLGTIGGLTDGTCVNQNNTMMVWNYWNRTLYNRPGVETTASWGPTLTPGGRNHFTRMNPGAYTIAAGTISQSPWSYYVVIGRSPTSPGLGMRQVLNEAERALRNPWPLVAASGEFRGNLRVKIATFPNISGNGETVSTSEAPAVPAITNDLRDDTLNLLGTPFAFSPSQPANTNIGTRVYQVMQALGTNPLLTTVSPNAVRPQFVGVSSRITFIGEC